MFNDALKLDGSEVCERPVAVLRLTIKIFKFDAYTLKGTDFPYESRSVLDAYLNQANVTLFTRDILQVIRSKLNEEVLFSRMHFDFVQKFNQSGERVVDECWTTDYWRDIQVWPTLCCLLTTTGRIRCLLKTVRFWLLSYHPTRRVLRQSAK